MFIEIGRPIANATNAAVESLIVNYGNFFEAISTSLLTVLITLESALRDSPPWVILLIIGLLAYAASRRIVTAISRLEALHRRPGFDQRSVDAEVLRR